MIEEQEMDAKSLQVAEAPVQGRFERMWRMALFVGLVGTVGMAACGTGAYLHFAPSVPEFDSIADYQPLVGSRVYSADNQLIGEFAAERRVLIAPDKLPPLLLKAFISAEDKRFYHHSGLDMIGISQAIVDKVLHPGQKLRGASTITQQVAKSLLATQETYESATERSFSRKIREAILARRLEASLTKDQILYIYVHQIFLGHKAYGVGAAAEHYFRKNVAELTIAEMATLAGLPQRPSDYSPVMRPEAALARRRYVLRRMLSEGYITNAEFETAANEELKVYPLEELYLSVAPHYTEQVRREIVERYGERALLEDGLEIYTAVNIEQQGYAEAAVERGLRELDRRQGYRGALSTIPDVKTQQLFLTTYRERLGAEFSDTSPWVSGKRYLALVTGFLSQGEAAVLSIAGREGYLPLAAMRWARTPEPMQRIDAHLVTDVRRVLKVGDVISVMPVSREVLPLLLYAQDVAGKAPATGDLFKLDQEPIAQAALMSVEPKSGYVTAQIGGYHFEESTYNRAIQACREPGSAFKPIVYSAALDKLDYTASTLIEDKPIIFDDPDNAMRWKPNNAGQEFRGILPLRTCLKDSINMPALRIAEAVGIEDILKNARRLGVSSKLKRELGTALGSSCTTLLDLMNVYVTFNQLGQRRDLKFVRRVVDRHGNVLEDDTVPWDPTLELRSRLDRAYEYANTPPRQALDRQTAFLMTSLLKNVVTSGTATMALQIGQIAAGKTGTTNDSYDAWFMGYTHNLVTGVWVGHDKKERPLGVNEQGGHTALPVWVYFMSDALNDYTGTTPVRRREGDFDVPEGVVQAAIDPETGLLARPGSTRSVSEWYRAGSEPTEQAPDKAVFDAKEFNPFEIDTPL